MEPIDFGEYQLLEALPMLGNVFERCKARHTPSQKIVILKRFAQPFINDFSLITKFLYMMEHTKKLSHRNIAQVIEVDEVEDRPFFVEEYAEGHSLEDLLLALPERKGLPFELAAYIAASLCTGLQYVHQYDGDATGLTEKKRGERQQNPPHRQSDSGPAKPPHLIHGDLCPAEILCTLHGEVKLGNIGISSFRSVTDAEQLLDDRVILFGYLSPEAARGAERDSRTDIFGVGAVLYEMLAGQRAFDGGSNLDTLVRIMYGRYTPLQERRPALPPILQEVTQRALLTVKEARYQSAAEMEKELRSFLGASKIPTTKSDLAAFVRLTFHETSAQQELLQRETHRISTIPWLHPDAEMESLQEDALAWLEMRFDEHLSSLRPYLVDADFPDAKVQVTRSLYEAMERYERTSEKTLSREVFTWHQSLERVNRRISRLFIDGAPTNAFQSEQIFEARQALQPSAETPEAHQELLSRWWFPLQQSPPAEILNAHILFLLTFGGEPEMASPWAPFVAMWERGVWPVGVLEDGLWVYVPVWRGEALVASPESPSLVRPLPRLASWLTPGQVVESRRLRPG